MISAYIKGTGEFFPENIVTNTELSKTIDTSDEWIVTRTGIQSRRIAKDDELASDMAYYASKKAIDNAGLKPSDIDYVLFSITYSEQSFPNTAARLQQKLGIDSKCPCLDINAACTGWMYGLELADTLIKSKKYKNILLVGGEKPSAFLDWTDRNTSILFGDGCGAVVVSDNSAQPESKLIDVKTYCDSSHIENLTLVNGGLVSPLKPEDFVDRPGPFKMHMNGKMIFKEAVTTMAQLSADILKENDMTVNDVDWFIPHQANLRIIEAVGQRLEIDPKKVLLNIENYGNTSSATIPSALSRYVDEGKIKPGDKILIAAFGAGLTAASAIFVY